MSGRFVTAKYTNENINTYNALVSDIKNKLIPKKSDGVTEDTDLKNLLYSTPSFNVVSNIEAELLYDAKLRLALTNPQAYFDSKKEALEALAVAVNTEFKNVFTKVYEYATREEAKKMAIESARNIYNVGMHKINSEYPEKLDKDLEHKLLVELKNKLIK